VFAWIGRFAFRWRWPIIAFWALLFAAALPILPKVQEPLKLGGFSSPDTESARTRDLLMRELHSSPTAYVIIFQSDSLRATDKAFVDQIETTLAGIDRFPGVTGVLTPTDELDLISDDGSTAYALVGLALPPEEAQRDVEAFRAALHPTADLTFLVAGGPAFYADIETVSQRDLRRAEFIAFPFAAVTLLLVFGSVVAACVPLIVGGLGVACVLLTLFLLGHEIDLSIFVLNLATMLGLGLAVDYSLFITSRFREELPRRDQDVAKAVERTVATAGRAIFFSGLTVLIGLFGLSFFSFMFLRSVGIAGVVVVFFSVLAALTLLPALLAILGPNIERFRIVRRPTADRDLEHGFWAALSRRVMAHPVVVLVPTLAFLLILGLPFLKVSVSSPDATILPKDLASRQGFDILTDKFGPGEISPFTIAVQSPTTLFSAENAGALYDFTGWLKQQPGVVRVESAVSYNNSITREQAIGLLGFRKGLDRLGLDTRLDTLINDHTAAVFMYTDSYPNSQANKDLLSDLRSHQPGGDLRLSVNGGTAEIVDVVSVMYRDFPLAIAVIVVATYLVLLLLFRSLLLPLKAIVMNTLSIVASYGALVFVFQQGHFSSILRFEPIGFVEASLPVIMFCILFGLSMDYEVFLLSRVREEWERTGDNQRSVAMGLQRSGRIITSAALIVVVVTASFVSADVILIKALGFGIALAVFLDATIVRALLVPATMRLLGNWNWWLPAPLKRLMPANLAEESP
jgi:RND superfamily putative drug exporter